MVGQLHALKNAGKDAFFQMEFQKAVDLFTKAIALKPNDTNLYGLRCAAYNKLQKYEQALGDVDKMIELRPYNHKTYLLKGNCHFFLGEYEEAVEAYEAALQAHPSATISDVVTKAIAKINERRQRKTNSLEPNAILLRKSSALLTETEKEQRKLRFKQHCAAIRIQSAWRGYNLRERYGSQITEIRNRAARKIESRRTASRRSEHVFSSRLSSMVHNETEEEEDDSDDEVHVHHTHKPPVYRQPKPKKKINKTTSPHKAISSHSSSHYSDSDYMVSVDDINKHVEHIQQYTFASLQKTVKVPTYATKHQRCHRCRVVYGPPALPDFVI